LHPNSHASSIISALFNDGMAAKSKPSSLFTIGNLADLIRYSTIRCAVALAPCEGIAAADRAAIFNTFGKASAQREGVTLTYMAKPLMDLPGCGGHLHLSLWSEDGMPLFFSPNQDDGLSAAARHFVGGQERYMAELLAMTSPTVNAFTRLTPGYWAPTAANWGFDNRTCSLRVVGRTPKAARVEYRVSSADANPYLVLAAALASGLQGMEEQIEPDPPVSGNAYEATPGPGRRLPRTLHEAAGLLRGSAMAREWFGETFVDHFAVTREVEEKAFRGHVSDWELNRYFEII
jgi:glutamine synthetase